jgi:hypothetical protein
VLAETLQERDALILQTVKSAAISKVGFDTLVEFLAMDRRDRTALKDRPRYLLLDEDAAGLVQDLQSVTLHETSNKIQRILKHREDLTHSLAVAERKLSTVPDAEAIAPIEQERLELDRKRQELEQKAA